MENVTFKYIFSEDYNPQYINGAFGGVGPQGEIIIHFYCERGAIPKKVEHSFGEEGTLSDPISIDPDDFEHSFIRFVQSGIIVDKTHAKGIYDWLGRMLGESDEK